MTKFFRAIALLPILALAGCATAGTTYTAPAPQVVAAPQPQVIMPTPAQTTATALQTTDVNGFVDGSALALMTGNDKTQASNAQFYSMQFGRPGAPRAWSGDKGTKGSVTVGPYVRVNNLDCRDYTHTVTLGGQSYVKKGMACREADGRWAAAS